ncbi:hypothetical protein JG688_00007144 [Phytophthora aleatoria]|uniref:Glycylpeptide N-tetradecanoyltransferase n=1 Tax=Phytophthora aleatoria TaxID=2496075 RepID=A0A8J5J6F4_9STRA|nr:hypothetical protein JG688_00007144 [Phytophthora aleatoria]
MSSSPPPTGGKPDDKLELVTVEEQEEFLQVLKQLNLATAQQAPPDRNALAAQKDFKFWKTQPVPALDEFPREHGAIDPPKAVSDLPETTSVPGFRAMQKKDVAQVTALLKTYLAKFDLVQQYDQNDVAHWMLPRQGVINAYVVENPETHKITDFTSFYHLPSTVIGHDKHNKLNAAYSFYNVATSVPLTDLMNDTLIMAKKDDFDVFNALSLMDNMEFLKELKFGPGDGDLMYYLYNWRCPRMEGDKVGIVLC